MSVGRDGILPIGYLTDYDEAIVSSAYFAFKVKDESVVLPEYLMLCFRRSEFDRELWFKSGGDVRGGSTWEDLCEIEVPIPTLLEQKNIVIHTTTLKGELRSKER